MDVLFDTLKWISNNILYNSNTRLKYSTGIVSITLLTLLAACGPVPTEQPITPTATSAPTFTPFPATSTTLPTGTPLSTVAPTLPPPFPMDGYVGVFQKDGDLYFQDGNNPPVQLTYGGERPHSPILSDDDQKVVFLRGESSSDIYAYPNIYSVNTDGSEEQTLITEQWLAKFGNGMGVRRLSFESGTHQVYFNVCESKKYSSPCVENSFSVNVDTGKIEEYSQNFSYKSPDGKMIAAVSSGYIDILDLDNNLIRQKVLPFKVTRPVPIATDIQWLPDSNGLIVAIPNSDRVSVYEGDLTYTVWHYSIEDNVAYQVPLDPIPALTFAQCSDVISESPDRNWGLYNTRESELYLLNLATGETKLYETDAQCSEAWWSSDSKHFFYGIGHSTLGTIDGPSIKIATPASPTWIDATHFVFVDETMNITIKSGREVLRIGEIVGKTIRVYDYPDSYLLIKPK